MSTTVHSSFKSLHRDHALVTKHSLCHPSLVADSCDMVSHRTQHPVLDLALVHHSSGHPRAHLESRKTTHNHHRKLKQPLPLTKQLVCSSHQTPKSSHLTRFHASHREASRDEQDQHAAHGLRDGTTRRSSFAVPVLGSPVSISQLLGFDGACFYRPLRRTLLLSRATADGSALFSVSVE
ncbi:hypothetical protein BC835DRAFT_132506 [Cytidiella melzeri]|nr:hypothetical protein BC835DRAFT_132506 [Cytidiella melzeri]